MTAAKSRIGAGRKKTILIKELVAFEERLNTRFDGIETRFDGLGTKFDGFETRFDGLETRFDGIETRFDSKLDIQTESLKGYIDSKISQVNLRFDIHDEKFANIDKDFAHIDVRFDTLEKQLKVNTDGLVEMIERNGGEIIGVEKRISVLEAKN